MSSNKNRRTAANSEAIEDLSTGTHTHPAVATPAKTAANTASPAPYAPVSEETLLHRTVTAYLESISGKDVALGVIRDTLLSRINSEFSLENMGRKNAYSTSPQIAKVHVLDEATVVRVLLARFDIVKIDLADGLGGSDMELVAMYVDEGPDEGIYSTSADELMHISSELKPSLNSNAMRSLYESLRIQAPKVRRTMEPHLCPVNNGVFDTVRQELRPFSPEWVFLTKPSTKYEPHAKNPIVTMPDGALWDVESWIQDLSDDEGVPELLWEAISAAVRPHVAWHKSLWLTAEQGNNGKGTYVQLIRNLVGPAAYSSVQLVDFGSEYKKEGLVRASVNLVDENDVGMFGEKLGDWKAAITGDVFTMNRKYKTPVQVRWRGFEIQCFNSEVPRVKDRSGSFLRRVLMVPFRKSYEGVERKYIKTEYLARADVLEYVLKRVLQMPHTELSNPPACSEALREYAGANNKAIGFWREFEHQFVWSLVPSNFLYDLYKAWLGKTDPSAKPEGSRPFIATLKAVLADSPYWTFKDAMRPDAGGMKQTETLIVNYDLQDWMPDSYTGSDPLKRSTMDTFAPNYRGFLRVAQLPALPFDEDPEA